MSFFYQTWSESMVKDFWNQTRMLSEKPRKNDAMWTWSDIQSTRFFLPNIYASVMAYIYIYIVEKACKGYTYIYTYIHTYMPP